MERTLILVKPDGVQRGLVGEIVGRFERRGLKIVGMKLVQAGKALAEEHYAEHRDKGFFAGVVGFITSSPVVALVLEGEQAIALARQAMGATRPWDAAPGTIRADFGITVDKNLVHGSANEADAAREIALWFSAGEIVAWQRATDAWL